MNALRCQLIPVVGLMSALLLSACGPKAEVLPTVSVKGTVTSKGQPLKEGMISFQDSSRGVGFGGTIADGQFTIDEPVQAGNYRVAVMPPPPPPPDQIQGPLPQYPDIPRAYRLAETSSLTATVVAGQENVLSFDLK